MHAPAPAPPAVWRNSVLAIDEERQGCVLIRLANGELIVANEGAPFTDRGFRAICTLHDSAKQKDRDREHPPRLVATQGDHRRFQYGFWHLEPLVIALKASTLMVLVAYAFLSAVNSLLKGGYEPEFGVALS